MNDKQDRQGVRTPAQLEQKYNYGQKIVELKNILIAAKNAANQAIEAANKATYIEKQLNLLISDTKDKVDKIALESAKNLDGECAFYVEENQGTSLIKGSYAADPLTVLMRGSDGNVGVGLSVLDRLTNKTKIMTGDAVPISYIEEVMEAVYNTVNFANESKIITSYYATDKYNLDWNCMYFLLCPNGGMTIYNAETDAAQTDVNGESLPDCRLSILILPKITYVDSAEETLKKCLYIGLNYDLSDLNSNVLVSRQFDVSDGALSLNPALDTSVCIWKIAFGGDEK